MKKNKYSEEKIRQILKTAYPGKNEEEIEDMVHETMEQYLAESKKDSKGSGKKSKKSDE